MSPIFICNLDELGRIGLPEEMCKALNIELRDNLEFFLEGDKIILKKHEPVDTPTGKLRVLPTIVNQLS